MSICNWRLFKVQDRVLHVGLEYALGTETVMTEVAGWSVQYHPDVNKDSDADNKFKSIRLAYEVPSPLHPPSPHFGFSK
jgi:hypothetical protein